MREAVRQLQDAGILQAVTPADVLAKYQGPIAEAIRRDMHDQAFLDLWEARGGGRWALSLAKVPQDLQTDQSMGHLMGDFAREVAGDAGRFSERLAHSTKAPRSSQRMTNTAKATVATWRTAMLTSRWQWARRS